MRAGTIPAKGTTSRGGTMSAMAMHMTAIALARESRSPKFRKQSVLRQLAASRFKPFCSASSLSFSSAAFSSFRFVVSKGTTAL